MNKVNVIDVTDAKIAEEINEQLGGLETGTANPEEAGENEKEDEETPVPLGVNRDRDREIPEGLEENGDEENPEV